ncbi:MAG: hypothetical protein E7Z93_02430 [Cyanobacteria bacterium SIG32]|nr:hypothetical protein [Cyanobacteria bacterium SIG32]
MKNVLIFLSIFTVVMLAVIDAKERIKELDTIAGKTPAQVEMKDDILNPSRDKTKENVNLDIQSQQNRNNLFNQKLKEQQSNNLPQSKQPSPLNIKK